MSTPVTTNVLVLEFLDATKKTKSVRISNPKEDLTAAQVEEAMDKLVDLNAFATFHINGPMSLKGAKSVQTVTNKFDIVID